MSKTITGREKYQVYQLHVVIGGLDPGKAYRVSISASTNARQGEFTSAVIVDGKMFFST